MGLSDALDWPFMSPPSLGIPAMAHLISSTNHPWAHPTLSALLVNIPHLPIGLSDSPGWLNHGPNWCHRLSMIYTILGPPDSFDRPSISGPLAYLTHIPTRARCRVARQHQLFCTKARRWCRKQVTTVCGCRAPNAAPLCWELILQVEIWWRTLLCGRFKVECDGIEKVSALRWK